MAVRIRSGRLWADLWSQWLGHLLRKRKILCVLSVMVSHSAPDRIIRVRILGGVFLYWIGTQVAIRGMIANYLGGKTCVGSNPTLSIRCGNSDGRVSD